MCGTDKPNNFQGFRSVNFKALFLYGAIYFLLFYAQKYRLAGVLFYLNKIVGKPWSKFSIFLAEDLESSAPTKIP